MKPGAHDIAVSRFELRGSLPPPIENTAWEAIANAESGGWGIRRLAQTGRVSEAFERARERVRFLDGVPLDHRAPLVVAAAHLDLADAAILAGHLEEVGPHDERALSVLRSACGPDHPASFEALLAVERQVSAILERATPSDPVSRVALTDLAGRLRRILGPGAWIDLDLRWALYRHDRPARLGPAKAAELAELQSELAAARSLYEHGRFRGLPEVTGRAVAVARSFGRGAEAELADALNLQGLALAASGDFERSLAPFREAAGSQGSALRRLASLDPHVPEQRRLRPVPLGSVLRGGRGSPRGLRDAFRNARETFPRHLAGAAESDARRN